LSGIFTISLDFELHWGGFEKWPLSVAGHQSPVTGNRQQAAYDQYFLNTRQVIPRMLELFEHYDVHVTWAAVGMLLHKDKEELLKNAPSVKPTYKEHSLSAHHFIEQVGIGNNEDDDPFHFAPSLVNKILQTRNQELGTHTFAHFYCNESGQTPEQFREDLRAAKRAAALYDIKLRSLVFPRNQFNDQYLKVCFEEGITSVRSNPMDWFWDIQSTQNESKWKRLNRGLDAYFRVGKKNTYKLQQLPLRDGIPLCLPASRLLRPYRPSELVLNDLKINRVRHEMERAAKRGEVYHLWWHPHNFGWYREKNLKGLERILIQYKAMQDKYGMESWNMGEIYDKKVESGNRGIEESGIV